MGYVIGGVEREVDGDGYLLEPEFGDEAILVIAQAIGWNRSRAIPTSSFAPS